MCCDSLKTALNSDKESLASRLEKSLRIVPDFPKPGIRFRDLTPALQDAALCSDILGWMEAHARSSEIDVVAGIESRGFFFGFALAQRLGLPFVPIRKEGKLPSATFRVVYQLEYGEAALEIHRDALKPGARVLIHDDLHATGGTLMAATQLVRKCNALPALALVLTDLAFLRGPGASLQADFPLVSLVTLNCF